MRTKLNEILHQLSRSESGIMLGVFRIVFGVIMFYHIYQHWDRLEYYKDKLHLRFPYPELDWLPLFSYEGLLVLFFIGLICALGFILGIFYRYSAALMFVSYAYLFSMDSLYYNNHYYLLVLISFLMIFCRADARLALLKKPTEVPYWNYLILQLQLCIVFFYGGLSKVNSDWLGGYTLDSGQFSLAQNFFLGWGGMFFDLLIPFAILFRRTRWIAIILVLLFNATNHFLFDDIALYPLLASAALLIFLEGTNRLEKVQNLLGNSAVAECEFIWTKTLNYGFGLYFLFQLSYPLRHHVIPGHPEWTGQGHYFSWRMKSYQKQVALDVYAFDRLSKQRKYKINTGMDDYRIQRVGAMPHMILSLADHMKKKLEQIDGKDDNLGISADYKAGLNKLPTVMAIDPLADLSDLNFNCWKTNHWILEKPKRED